MSKVVVCVYYEKSFYICIYIYTTTNDAACVCRSLLADHSHQQLCVGVEVSRHQHQKLQETPLCSKKKSKTHMMMQRSIRQVLNRTVRNRRMMTSWVEDMNKGLTEVDPEICDIIEKEKHRQRSSLCLIGTRRHRPFFKNSLQH